eukprot:CAMPEP_0171095422 /NCGR_PEP_ID=MMETSP0766_2-20121228/43161_1 /TAXON_ID=439317 /ORGANISM="Gambierdiscus australes, Strain CAWD 149" /LENGTH=325 /DNA_ID=CAMNT_0011554227 /DNA_START=197 /DNA_END=1174 /DNA_ORIENTATION=+
MALVFIAITTPASTQANIDGGRSDLPGMKQDIFDQVQKNKKSGPAPRGKGPPECPKSDKMSPFVGLAFASGEMYVRINGTEGSCQRLITVAGANYTVLANASKTCGPAGEWKKRIAEELSAVFFQGGLEWVKSEGEVLEVVTEEGTFQAVVSEEKYKEQLECWKRGCSCEQAKNPKMRMIFMAVLVICVGGLSYDSLKLAWEKVRGKKPPKDKEKKAKKEKKEKKEKKGEKSDKEEDKKSEKSDREADESRDDGDAESRSEPESTTAGAAISSKAASEAEQEEESKEEEDKKDGDNVEARAEGCSDAKVAAGDEGGDEKGAAKDT